MRYVLALPGLLLAGCFCAFGSVDSGLLALLPSGVKTVGGFDVINARSSDFGQFLLAKSQAQDPHFQKLMEETGFDPRRDLQTLLFAGGNTGVGKRSRSFAVLARGSFDEQRIVARAKATGATEQSFQGVRMMVNTGKNEQSAFAFLDTGVAALADLATLKQIIVARSAPSTLDPALQSRINAVGSNDIWFAALGTGDMLAQHLQLGTSSKSPADAQALPQQAKVLESIVQSSGGIQLGSTVNMTFDAVTRSAQDATSLSDVVRFLASMVQMQRQSDPRADVLARALDTMSVQASGTQVHFAMSMPEKSLEQLADIAPNRNMRPGLLQPVPRVDIR